MSDLEKVKNGLKASIRVNLRTDLDPDDCQMVLTEIERLESELAAEKEKHNWIQANERLPENEVLVLVIMQRNYTTWVTVKMHMENGSWADENVDYWAEQDEITHWQPLPKLPESQP